MEEPILRIISDKREFADIRDQWNNLLNKSLSNTIFLTWEWMYTWWECFGEGKTLFVIVAEDNGEIVGIVPLYRTQAKIFGLSTLKHLEFLGTTGVITEYTDFIIQNGLEYKLVPAIINIIFQNSSDWDAFNLVSMRKDSINLKLIQKYCEDNAFNLWEYNTHTSPYIELPATIDEYFKTISNNSRWRIRKHRKNLEVDRKVELLETVDKKTVTTDFSTIIELHQKRWEKKGGPGSFSQSRKRFIKFHNTIIHRFFDNGWLYLLQLMVDGISVAGQYNFIYHNTVYYHSAGFNPDWAENNVGNVLQFYAVEDSIRKGVKEFDFLRGNEQYKYTWTKQEHTSVDTVIWRSDKIAKKINFERTIRKAVKTFLPKEFIKKIYARFLSRD
jgi:CelD/BcsL family acetyltransferase involved in cellulose biosynthesis